MEHVLTAPGCHRGLFSVGRLHGGDRASVLEVFEGMSERSRRLRFHGPKPRLREADLDRLVDVGCCGKEAVAAVDLVTGSVVGTARFVRDDADPRSAEVAFEVVDDCQGRGVGQELVSELTALARREGIERFHATVVPGNEPALALLRRAGRLVHSSYVDGAHELVIELEPAAVQSRTPLTRTPAARRPRERFTLADVRAA
jgi:RimJ/RimL family protein N-acetyltransferase